MTVTLSDWLPARDFSRIKWLSFYRSVPNNANDSRRQKILEETKDLNWVYLGDGTPDPLEDFVRNDVDNYTFPINYDPDLMRKTIQGSHRPTDKVQIWIGTPDNQVTNTSGFYKVIYDPATERYNLSAHADNANVLWNLGFAEGITSPPMAINYK